MLKTLVMTVIGPDRTGLVDSLARTVADQGGNWLESRLCHLGGQFAGLVQVEVEEAAAAALIDALQHHTESGLQITVQTDNGASALADGSLALVELVGQDRPGLLREITGVFAKHGLNVEELESERTAAPQGGGILFKASATILVPSAADLDAIGDDLEKIATDLLVDIRLAPETTA
ncbi:glycine cleavage system protein R [Synoicihabitans lomoniglobus]|uniref:ACT domain-containing protein n=1 Tax=Synoicihabitans lomoniglobus TaxID=2909285 RepID=A0AAE9ZUC0_9BACT|nr:ACT domain-containing protein [Opitutaceae bacterium LMO-M01]WED65310.1 ACT domain-containing protein [Opitutaceae bacterium LMO-M01]